MRKTATAALLFTFAFAAFSPSFAQRSLDSRSNGKVRALTAFDNAQAITDGAGALVRWQMKTETNVAAYNIYRIGNEGKVLVNPTPILGSKSRVGDRTAYAESYEFFDLDGSAGATYVVEGVRMDGTNFSTKEFAATSVRNLEAFAGRSSAAYIEARNSTNSNVESRTSALNSELSDLVSLYAQEPDPENQLWIAARPGAKLSVKREGFYRVSSAELATANFPVNSDSSKWRLFTNGVEQAITIGPNNQYIEFYGRGVDTPETDSRIYYLVEDTIPGKRIGSKVMRQIPGNAASTSYDVVAVKKERNAYIPNLFNGPDEENYVGRLIQNQATFINFNLSGIDYSKPTADITVHLYGYSFGLHEVKPILNGHELPLIRQFDFVRYFQKITIPTSHLLEGANELELSGHAPSDFNNFDKIEIAYARKFVTEDNKISFFTPGSRKVDISGFTTANVRVFDMTFEGNPVLVTNVPVVEGDEGYTAKIPSGRMMVGYAVEDTALLQVSVITENFPSTLAASSNAAEMLIISHSNPGFLNAAETWANYRRSADGGRFVVKVVNATDIFDEFGYGIIGPKSLKAFLSHANEEWATKPKYVLILGDGSYDPRNYEGFGAFNLVPSQSVSLISAESVSDDALVDFDDDGLSEVAIGRVPARTAVQVTTAFNKMVTFEADQQIYSRGVLFAHDLPLGYDFENMSQQLAQKLPAGTPVSMVSVGEQNALPNLVSRINEGKLFINYSGHGSAGLWANSGFFTVNTVPQVTNLQNPSFYSMLTCLNGLFTRPSAEAFAEALLFSPVGGAAASWASSSETTPDIQLIMGLRFVDTMSNGNLDRVGDLVKDAKLSISAGADVRLSWVLFGDPAMRMP